MPGLIDGRLPSRSSSQAPRRKRRRGGWDLVPIDAVAGGECYRGTLDDERRLFYVAVTRAQRWRLLSFAPSPDFGSYLAREGGALDAVEFVEQPVEVALGDGVTVAGRDARDVEVWELDEGLAMLREARFPPAPSVERCARRALRGLCAAGETALAAEADREVAIGVMDPLPVRPFYRAAALRLRALDGRGALRRFGDDADARWRQFLGELRDADLFDLLRRDGGAARVRAARGRRVRRDFRGGSLRSGVGGAPAGARGRAPARRRARARRRDRGLRRRRRAGARDAPAGRRGARLG